MQARVKSCAFLIYKNMVGSIVNTQNSNTPAIISTATALAANSARIAWQITNLSTNPLFVLLGSGASTSVFHYILKASSVANDGSGGVQGQNEGAVYTGIITIAGTSPSYTVLEIAP